MAALRSAPAALMVLALGALAAVVVPWARATGARVFAPAAAGVVAAGTVFALQSGTVGASLGGAVLALAAGAIAVLVVALFRNV